MARVGGNVYSPIQRIFNIPFLGKALKQEEFRLGFTTTIIFALAAAILSIIVILLLKVYLKKSLEFDLNQKKRLYEGKLAQYKRYYSMMDAFSARSRKTLFSAFQDGMFKLLQDPSDENTLEYLKSIFSLKGEITDQFLMFKTEIGGLRLEAGESLLTLLDEYIVLLEQSQERTAGFLNWMNSNAKNFITSPDETNAYIQKFMAEESTGPGQALNVVQEKMLKEMRRELGNV